MDGKPEKGNAAIKHTRHPGDEQQLCLHEMIVTVEKKFAPQLLRVGQRIIKLVGVLSVFCDVDDHLAGKANKLIRAGVGYDFNRELRYAAVHDAGVVKRKAAFAAFECAGYAFQCDINTGALCVRATGQHLDFAACLKIAWNLLLPDLLVKVAASATRVFR